MVVYKKILLLTITIVFLLSMTTSDANAQNLISIHSVQNITQMNTLSPEAGSILFVEDENANYQYNGSSWSQIGDASGAVTDTAGLAGLVSTLETFITTVDNCPECNPVFEVGDTLECGVVVYVEPNGRSGLVCAFNDLADMAFGCPSNTPVAVQGSSRIDGLNNSNLINASCNTSAATSCLNYNACGSGWYLPSRNELRFIRRNILIINNILINIGQTPLETDNSFYWSSSEIVGTPANAAAVYMGDSFTTQSSIFFWENDALYNQYYAIPYTSESKTSIGKIRPVKRFFYE